MKNLSETNQDIHIQILKALLMVEFISQLSNNIMEKHCGVSKEQKNLESHRLLITPEQLQDQIMLNNKQL